MKIIFHVVDSVQKWFANASCESSLLTLFNTFINVQAGYFVYFLWRIVVFRKIIFDDIFYSVSFLDFLKLTKWEDKRLKKGRNSTRIGCWTKPFARALPIRSVVPIKVARRFSTSDWHRRWRHELYYRSELTEWYYYSSRQEGRLGLTLHRWILI